MISILKLRNVLGTNSHFDARRANQKRRRAQRSLEPRGEGLEGRQLMAYVGLDPTFGIGGTAVLPSPASTATTYTYSTLSNLTLLSSGKYVGVGDRYNSTPSTNATDVLVERTNNDGTVDTAFGTNGTAVFTLKSAGTDVDSRAISVVEQTDGKLVILASVQPRTTPPPAGSLDHQAFAVIRLTANGALDTSFNTTGYQIVTFGTTSNSDVPTSLALTSSGLIVAAGYTYNTSSGSADFAVARLTSSGALDTTFNTTGKQTVAFDLASGKTDQANSVVVQADGSIILAGSATVGTIVVNSTTMDTSDIAVARLTSSGALDTTFNTTGKLTISYNIGGDNNDAGNAVALVGNQIVIAGTSTRIYFGYANNINDATLTRLSSSGAISLKRDLPLVQQGVTFSENVSSLNALSDGTLIIGGTANGYGTNTYGAFFTKFLPGGGLDGSFGTDGTAIISGTALNGNAAVEPGGKIAFVDYSGIHRTTAPAPEVVSAQLMVTSTARNASSNTIKVKFNTALNPTLASNVLSYRVRIGTRGNRFVRIRRVDYDPSNFTVTLTLGQRINRRTVLQVLVGAGGIAGADSQLLNGGALSTIPVTNAV